MKRGLLFPTLSLLLVLTVAFSMTLGKYPLVLSDIADFFLLKIFGVGNMDPERYNLLGSLLLDIRMPRILAAILIGASLAVAGSAFQAMFVNPLVSPSLLGVLAGASFGAALGMVFFKSWVAVQMATFLFGFLADPTAIVLEYRNRLDVVIHYDDGYLGLDELGVVIAFPFSVEHQREIRVPDLDERHLARRDDGH